MPKSVIHTYGKKRTTTSSSSSNNDAFDKLIQDVSNNTIKRVKLNSNNSNNNINNINDAYSMSPFKSPSKFKPTTTTSTKTANSHYDDLFEEENNDLKSASSQPTTKTSPNNKKKDLLFKPTFFKSKQNKQQTQSPSKKQQQPSPAKQQELQSTNNNTNGGISSKKTIKIYTDTETTTTTTTKCLRLTRTTRNSNNNKKTPNSTEDSIGSSSANSSCSSTTSITSNGKSNDLISPLKHDHDDNNYDFNDAFTHNNNKKEEPEQELIVNNIHPTTTATTTNEDDLKLIDGDNNLTTQKLVFKKSKSNCIYNTNTNNIPSTLDNNDKQQSSVVNKITVIESAIAAVSTSTVNKNKKATSYDYGFDNDDDDDEDDEENEFEKKIKCKLRLTKSSSDTTSPTTTSSASSSTHCNTATTTTTTASTSTSTSNSKYLGPKRIFSSKQTIFKSMSTSTTSGGGGINPLNSKITSSKYNYNLFDYSDEKTSVKSNRNAHYDDDDDDGDEFNDNDSNESNCAIKINDDNQSIKTKSTQNHNNEKKKNKDDGDESTVLLFNTRKAYECEELGETQGFTDDILYLMDGLNENFQLANRCLSAIKLAEYCVNSDFRMHLRSQGTVTKIFNLLHDSPKDHNLALCTACIMYALSRDKLVMDLDKSILELMIMILNMDLPKSDDLKTQLYKKNYEQCKNVCKKLNDDESTSSTTTTIKCESTKLDLDNLNANLLAMECLLSLTNRRTGEWCKEELRLLGALDHILNTIDKCVSTIQNTNTNNRNNHHQSLITDNIVKYTRCLKVLENVTHANKENQKYICTFNSNSFFVKLFKNSLNCFYKQLLSKNIDQFKKKLNSDAIKDTFLLLINITHNNEIGCEIISNDDEFIETIFIFIHECISYLTENEKFDVLIMALGVLLNLLDVNKEYRKKINRQIKLTNGQIISSLDIIINLYNNKQIEVSKAETDQEEEWAKLNQEIETQNVENINITVMNSIHKAGKHMEDHIVAANSAIIIGYVLLNDESSADEIRLKLNNQTFENMHEILKKFVLFMKIMKVTGFSVDEHLQEILTNLDKLNKAFTKSN